MLHDFPAAVPYSEGTAGHSRHSPLSSTAPKYSIATHAMSVHACLHANSVVAFTTVPPHSLEGNGPRQEWKMPWSLQAAGHKGSGGDDALNSEKDFQTNVM